MLLLLQHCVRNILLIIIRFRKSIPTEIIAEIAEKTHFSTNLTDNQTKHEQVLKNSLNAAHP